VKHKATWLSVKVIVNGMKTSLSEIQDLLNQEAQLANSGMADSEERMQIHTIIRLKRIAADGSSETPWCFGQDDCTTLVLSQCPWRIDCGD
jgi:hypothetical protein